MTIKIDAPTGFRGADNLFVDFNRAPKGNGWGAVAVRIVRESDWRKIMAVVRAADYWHSKGVVMPEVDALCKHLEKRK